MTDGYNKIDLNNPKPIVKKIPLNSQPKGGIGNNDMVKTNPGPKKKKKKILSVLLSVFILLIISGVVLFFPARKVYHEVKKTQEAGTKVLTAIKNQNLEDSKVELANTHAQLIETKKAYNFFGFLKFIPIIGGYYRDGDHVLIASLAGVEAGQISVDSLIPYADLLGLKGKSTFVSGSADQRIQTAVQTLDKLTPKLGEIAEKIETVKNNLNAIDLKRYPEKINDKEVRGKLLSLRQTFDDLSTLFINARPLLENLPAHLGQPNPQKYLILFQNDKELRPTGGFITAYAVFKVDKGKLIVETSDDIYKLDDKYNPTMSPPQQFITHLKQYKLHLRDANFDPDFYDSMVRFEEMYKTIPGSIAFDGIITVDTHVLVEAMKILGSIPAYGTNFTTDNDPRCDCPKVIYDLEEYAGRRVGYIREDRKDIIGVLLYQIMQKALGVSPSQYWGKLSQMVLSEFNQKHILVYFHNETSQKSLEALNFAGRMITNTEGDFLHINDANLGGAKSNMFVRHSIKQEYEKASDGRIIKTLTIDYKNPNEGSKGCNLEAGGLCLNGLMPNWLRIYVPQGSELVDFQGSEDPPVTSEAYSKTVFEGFLTVKPNNVSQITVKYKLPANFVNSKNIPLYIQKQPGTEGHEMTILVNDKEINMFNLTEDKKLEIQL